MNVVKPNTVEEIITLNGVNCYYGQYQALYDIDMVVHSGETVVLLGPSGAGKTSLLKVFNLLEVPSSGTMQLLDFNLDFSKKISEKEIKNLRTHVGIVFQNYNLWPHLSVLDNLIKAPKWVLKMSDKEAKKEAESILTRLNIQDFADRYPLHLSGGQQQRVAIARALMMKPEILLFDEPTAALDPKVTSEVADIILELAQTNITQIVVTHDVAFAKKIASKIVYLEDGKIVEYGDLSIFDSPKTEAFKNYLSHSF